MRRTITCITAIAAILLHASALPSNRSITPTPAAKEPATELVMTKSDSTAIASLLAESHRTRPKGSLELFFAKKLLNKPYVAHTLEVADSAEPLVVNLRQLDCTTLVETVTALTLCAKNEHYSVADYRQMLTKLRYRGGHRNGYASRLHYFSDWIADNSRLGLVGEIDLSNIPKAQKQTVSVSYMSSHPNSYKALRLHPELTAEIRNQEQQLSGTVFTFLPKAAVEDTQQLRKMIHDGDIIAITCSKPGLDIAHLGFAVWQADGLHLLNASQLHKKVVLEPMTLKNYLKRHTTHTGIRVVRIK